MTETTITPQASESTPRPEPTNDLAVASMVLGLVSLTGFGLLTGIPAIILGSIALKRPGGRGFSLTGIISGAITTVLSLIGILLFVFLIALAANAPEVLEDTDIPRSDTPYSDSFTPGSI